MHTTSRRALRRWLKVREAHKHADTPWVFLGRDGRRLPNGFTEMLQRLSRDHGVTLLAHSFRRAFAHIWASTGMPDDSLMSVAGWRSSRMPSVYRAEQLLERVPTDFHRVFSPDEVLVTLPSGRQIVRPGRRRS